MVKCKVYYSDGFSKYIYAKDIKELNWIIYNEGDHLLRFDKVIQIPNKERQENVNQ